MTYLRKLSILMARCRQMTISGSEPLTCQELGGVFYTQFHHLWMSMSKILRGWEYSFVRGRYCAVLASDAMTTDGQTDLVDSLCRTPTSFTLRSYIRLGNLV